MATKTTNKNALPKIHKKWYDFEIDPKTMRPIRFSWHLASGTKMVYVYEKSVNKEEIYDVNLRRYVTSYYFVHDKTNKRIFLYPIALVKNNTRSECSEAHYEKINTNSFYMFDENKQIWEIPYREYRKCCGYNYAERQYMYEMVKAEPRKVSRLSTYYYKVQCQLTSHIRSMFASLYGDDFVYQNRLVTDADIRNNGWVWNCWLNTKGRKYSDKTIQSVDEIMNKFAAEQRVCIEDGKHTNASKITLETHNDVTALCYFSEGYEVFRQIFNNKTGKMNYFIWKQGKWHKSGKLNQYQTCRDFKIEQSYIDANKYDYQFLSEAYLYFKSDEERRGCWYNPEYNTYKFVLNYISHPVIHQILQIANKSSRDEMYKNGGHIEGIFGKIPNRGKTMFAKLGVNKYQFENTAAIAYMKWLFNTNNISHIDNNTWNKCDAAFGGLKPGGDYRDGDIINYLKGVGEFSLDRWMKICELDRIEKQRTSGYYYSQIKQLYKDYYSSLSALKEFGIDVSSYPLLFNDKQQLQRYHDEASRAMSSVKNKAQDEKFEMLYGQRYKMLENDGKYLIDMPKCSADLTEEGSKLHHCVGGYVNSVANGTTAIYFLRQASAPDVPWLTVEVRNKNCMQIHGSCNAWMGSKDEYFDAVPFLVWWFEKHNIEYSENLLTNMATGYGQSSNRRNMPTAAIEQYKALRKLKKSS